MRAPARRWLPPLVLSVAAAGLVYLGFAAERAARVYGALTDPQRAFRGQVHRPDPELGFAPVPGAIGADVFRDAPEVPVRYDRDGFRVPLAAADAKPRPRPLVMALGCSFTFGQGVLAEHTFAHLVGKELGGSSINAGVCGYGLAQMLLVARRDLERFRPDVVLLQYSPWLARRSVATRAPSAMVGEVPTPYFSGEPRRLILEPPRFLARAFTTISGPSDHAEEWSWSGLVAFLLLQGIPRVVHDQVRGVFEHAEVVLGRVAPPAPNPAGVEKVVVPQIAALAKRSGATVVVVALGSGSKSERVPRGVRRSGAIVVDANAALRRQLSAPSEEAYQAAYWQERGTPPVRDAHPNERAHEVVARAIVRALERSGVRRAPAKGLPVAQP